MRKRVLLVNPWIYDFAAYDFGIKPVGLLKIASYLRFKNDVSFIDCLANSARSRKGAHSSKFRKERIATPAVLGKVERPYFRYGISVREFRETLSRLKKPHAIYVATGMTYWYPGVQAAVKILKEFFPDVPVTLGGIYATLCFEHALETSGADYVWKGDYVPASSFRDFPAYDLLDDKSAIPISASRGCPFRCTYCGSFLLSDSFTQRDPVSVFEELRYCEERFGTDTFVFYDDALFYNSNKGIKRILRILRAAEKKYNFYTPNGLHARFVDEELAFLLKEAQFRDLRLSLESSDAEIQELTGRKVDNDDLKRAVLLLNEAGFGKGDMGVYILVGAPWTTMEKTREDIFFLNSIGVKAILASYAPVPGTEDYKVLTESGIIEPDMDPLWHNKAVFAERLMPGMTKDIQDLRRFASKLNKAEV